MSPREVPLANGLVALVDPGDYRRVMKHRWYALRTSKTKCYAGFATEIDGRRRTVYLHRFLMEPEGRLQVDHRNGNGLDCTRDNLRVATSSQNNCNRKSARGSSKYKGVTFDKKSGKWRASIKLNKKQMHLGTFANEADAAIAYDKAAMSLHGEFARPNFPLLSEEAEGDLAPRKAVAA